LRNDRILCRAAVPQDENPDSPVELGFAPTKFFTVNFCFQVDDSKMTTGSGFYLSGVQLSRTGTKTDQAEVGF
jgi:hypothetical protein